MNGLGGVKKAKTAPASRRERLLQGVGSTDSQKTYATAFSAASPGSGTSEIVFSTCEAIW